MMKFAKTGLIVATLLSLSACAVLNTENTAARVATTVATLKVIEKAPVAEREARADRVVAIATEVKEQVSKNAAVTVDALIVVIRAQVPWSELELSDRVLVSELLVVLHAELVDRFGEEALPEDVQLAANVVAGWVITAASMY